MDLTLLRTFVAVHRAARSPGLPPSSDCRSPP